MIPRVGVMNVYNEEDFVEYSIRSVINSLDKLIVIYGWFAETKRGTKDVSTLGDNTFEILEELKDEFGDKIHIVHSSGRDQLSTRSLVFDQATYCGFEDYWLWIIDGDEVYSAHDLFKLNTILLETKAEAIKINSLTFVNDFTHYVGIAFPRLFRIRPENQYTFMAPNDLLMASRTVDECCQMKVISYESDVKFFHYSYCKSPGRFMLKKREREALPGGKFKWYLDKDGRVAADGVNIRIFTGAHPAVMASHPRFKELNRKV